MADYSKSSKDTRSTFPENAVDAQEWSRVEPLLTPEQLTRRFLWGVPLLSATMNPITRKYDQLEAEDLQDMIQRAVAQIEMDSKIDIFPVQRLEKKPFDRNEVQDGGYMRANYRPILSVDSLTIAPGNSPDILTIPPEWIAKDGFARGEIRIVPTLNSVVAGGYIPADGSVGQGSTFIAIMGAKAWLPSFWNLTYTTGFADGRLPKVLNELIGCYAAIDALSLLATTNRNNSQSIGMDGGSQSVSNGGPQIYDGRIKVLEDKRIKLLNKFRAMFGNKFAIGNI
jgi:hypothetical protein